MTLLKAQATQRGEQRCWAREDPAPRPGLRAFVACAEWITGRPRYPGMEPENKQGRGKLIAYWALTALFVLPMLAGGVSDILHTQNVVDTFEKIGYPLSLATILGVAKLLGVVALLAPKFPRLKEWAYAGFTFDLLGAAASHAFVSDWAGIVPPLILLAIMAGSYLLRPASRRIP